MEPVRLPIHPVLRESASNAALLLPKNRRKGRLVLGPSRSGANLQLLLRKSPPPHSHRQWHCDGEQQNEEDDGDEDDRPLRPADQDHKFRSSAPVPKTETANYEIAQEQDSGNPDPPTDTRDRSLQGSAGSSAQQSFSSLSELAHSDGGEAQVESGRICLPKELTTRLEHFKWNASFQELYAAMLNDAGEHIETIIICLRRISALYEDFLRTAVMYTRIIVSERFLEDHLKTVRPADVGGVAGGDKFIVEGIFFKLSRDRDNIYGGDSNASKSAGHELKSLNELQNLEISGLCYPLFAIIDYRGFRVSAISLLPIGQAVNRETQLYGSANGGRKVLNNEEALAVLLSKAATLLNLRDHFAGPAEALARISLPVDLEGHRGSDARYYILDAARLMPPEPPTSAGSHLYRLLRPELVRASPVPLCSDAYTKFIEHDPAKRSVAFQLKQLPNISSEYAHDVKTISTALREHIVPEFANWLLQKERNPTRPLDGIQLRDEMHRRGINMRCLEYWRRRVMGEMVVRVAKNTLRALMRNAMKKIKLTSEEPYARVTIQYFNLLFGSSPASEEYWRNELSSSIRMHFYYLATVAPPPLVPSFAPLPSHSIVYATPTLSSDSPIRSLASPTTSPSPFATPAPSQPSLLSPSSRPSKLTIPTSPRRPVSPPRSATPSASPSPRTYAQAAAKPPEIPDASSRPRSASNCDSVTPRSRANSALKLPFSGSDGVTRKQVDLQWMLKELMDRTGVALRSHSSLHRIQDEHFEADQPFSEIDIGKQQPKTKTMDIVEHSRTFVAYQNYLKFGESDAIVESIVRKISSELRACFEMWIKLKKQASGTGLLKRQATVSGVTHLLSLGNIPHLTTERILQIVHKDLLWRQAQEHCPTFWSILDTWADQCKDAGISEMYLAVHCCRAEIFQKLVDTSRFAECLAIVRAHAKEVRPSGKLYPYLLSKAKIFNGAVTF